MHHFPCAAELYAVARHALHVCNGTVCTVCEHLNSEAVQASILYCGQGTRTRMQKGFLERESVVNEQVPFAVLEVLDASWIRAGRLNAQLESSLNPHRRWIRK